MSDDEPVLVPSSVGPAVYANTYKTLSPGVDAIGLRTNELLYRNLSWSTRSRPAEDFLVNTRLRRGARDAGLSAVGYFSDTGLTLVSMIGREEEAGFAKVHLPESVPMRLEVGVALSRRRSARTYTGDPLPLAMLAALVRSAAAVTCEAEVKLSGDGSAKLRFRTAPSAGGLYPVHLFFGALNVTGLSRGIYRYDPIRDVAWQSGSESGVDKLVRSFMEMEDTITMSRACVIFVLVGQPWRTMRKYGDRGVRYLFLEAGAMAQNINLSAVSLGFGSVDCASYYDDELHEALEIDGLFHTSLHTVVVGLPG